MSDALKAIEDDVAYLARNMSGIPMSEWNAISNRILAAARALTAAEARAEAAEAKLAEALLNPVSAAPSPAPDEVEAVARAINPRAWDVMDYELRETQKKYAGQNVAWSVSQFQHAESMDQARAAIAALRPTNQEPRND